MIPTKIYITLLDGNEVLIPIDAKQKGEDTFEILDDKEYRDYKDPLYIHEFYPDDIVKIEDEILPDGSKRQVAKNLIKLGGWKDRKLNEFKFKTTFNKIEINAENAEKYRNEIIELKGTIANGQTFYQGIHDAVNQLEKFIWNIENIK